MKAEKCKGFKDLTPDDMRAFRFVEDTFRDCCLGWGYDEFVRQPSSIYIFYIGRNIDSEHAEKVYSFLDWDG